MRRLFSQVPRVGGPISVVRSGLRTQTEQCVVLVRLLKLISGCGCGAHVKCNLKPSFKCKVFPERRRCAVAGLNRARSLV